MDRSPSRERAGTSDLLLGRGLIVMGLLWIIVVIQIGLSAYFRFVDPSRAGVPLPIIIGFSLSAIGATVWWNFRRRWIDRVAASGDSVPGRIEALGSSYDRGGRLHYVRFAYEVGGRFYQRKQYYFPEEIVYEEGQSVRVLFDKANPRRALLG